MSNLKKIGTFWLNESAKGKYFSGKVEEAIQPGQKILVFRNDYKKEDKHPDYNIFIEAVEDEPERSQQQEPEPVTSPEYPESDIPF